MMIGFLRAHCGSRGAQTFLMRWTKTGLLVGVALLAGGGVVLGQEGPSANASGAETTRPARAFGTQKARFPTESESPRVRAPIANTAGDDRSGLDDAGMTPIADLQLVQGKPSANTSGA